MNDYPASRIRTIAAQGVEDTEKEYAFANGIVLKVLRMDTKDEQGRYIPRYERKMYKF